jgi:energy-coupling factor transporter ATP-binding protein EcfA2
MDKIPFIFGKSSDLINFTNREDEVKRLKTNFESLTNTTIISPRRWGKTSLVEHVATIVRNENKKTKICTLDIFNIRTEAEFYEYFAKEIIKGTSSRWEEMVDTSKKFLSHLVPKISVSPDTQAEITFGVGWETIKQNPDDILNLPEKIAVDKKINVIICIDEFQAIGNFTENLAFQRKLRSHWQHHHNVGYCFYGSKRTMLLEIFSNASMPFYRFGDIMFLSKIDNKKWGLFIQKRFNETGKNISREQAEYLAEVVENHSYYVQQLAQQVWLRTTVSCSIDIIDESLQTIKNQLSLLFTNIVDTLSNTQINFLKAVINGETSFTSHPVLSKYRLGSSSNITKIKATLTSRELIDISNKNVDILDPIFSIWLKEEYFT